MNSSEILNKIPQTLKNLKEKNPLTQCITNYVTVNDVANGLLAIGASPLMSEDPQEQKDIVNINDSLVINKGVRFKKWTPLLSCYWWELNSQPALKGYVYRLALQNA